MKTKPIIKPREDINWRKPTTELEHVYLSLLLWNDIYINKLSGKIDSKYFIYIKNMKFICPLCEFYNFNCSKCFLVNCRPINSLYQSWRLGIKNKYAYHIYKRIEKRYYQIGK